MSIAVGISVLIVFHNDWAVLVAVISIPGGIGALFGGGRSGRGGLWTSGRNYGGPMPPPLPGRLCEACGQMTSLDQDTCQHCGARLVGEATAGEDLGSAAP